MRKSEPANPREPQTDRNTTSVQQSAIAAEMAGYADIGMGKEALRAVRKVLAKRRILPEEFGEALRTIGIYGSSFKKWKPKLEAAYNRQSRKFQREARPNMVEMYGSVREWKAGTTISFDPKGVGGDGNIFWNGGAAGARPARRGQNTGEPV